MPSFVTPDGVTIDYEIRGTGPRVYACAGGPAGDRRCLVEDLVPCDSVQFVFHDYRGSGRSGTAPPETYSFDTFAADLDALRRELGDEKIVILGHSMGGLVAQAYAIGNAVYVDRLVLAGTFATTDPRTMALPTLRALGALRLTKMVARSVWTLVWWSWRPASIEKERHKFDGWTTTQEGSREVRAREREREIRLDYPLDNDNIPHLRGAIGSIDFRADLARLVCPVLVLLGARRGGRCGFTSFPRAALPTATMVVLPETGHDPFFEAPAASFAALRTFLA